MSEGDELLLNGQRTRQLTMALASGLRTAGYYEPTNAVMQQACSTLLAQLNEICEELGPLSFRAHSHCVFVDKVRVPTSASTYERFTLLLQLFEAWGINALTFHPDLTEPELMRTLMLMSRTRLTGGEDLSALLKAEGIERVTAEKIQEGTGKKPRPIAAVVAYSAAMQLGVEMGMATGPVQTSTVRRARHITQALVDEILRDPTALLTLTTIKDYDNYLILHSTNVAVLSTVLGQRLGLDKRALGELCLAGFMHDAGKLGVDPDVLNKPGRLNEEEWEQMRRHPVLAAHSLLNGQRLTESIMRSVVVAFEHHLNFDLSGYPPIEVTKSLSLFGGIVSIADRFDALTTARVYRKVNLTPPEAVVGMVEKMGTHFDPVLVKLFIEVMGIYPPGTVVVLSGGEAGVVCKPPAVGMPLDRPRVRVVVGGAPGAEVDLMERANGGYARSIIGILNPSNKGQIPAVDPAIFASLG
jgi:HD-GYP domain-containing protein (c-di-GMP phosphodiesterase class II)